jgi:hypothetical protein
MTLDSRAKGPYICIYIISFSAGALNASKVLYVAQNEVDILTKRNICNLMSIIKAYMAQLIKLSGKAKRILSICIEMSKALKRLNPALQQGT